MSPGRWSQGTYTNKVANAFLLYANYKHYHWQTYGPLFRDLHLLFDELANSVPATAAAFAERLRMMVHLRHARPPGLANDDNDPGTVDLFSRTAQLHEKTRVVLRQILLQKDGLAG